MMIGAEGGESGKEGGHCHPSRGLHFAEAKCYHKIFSQLQNRETLREEDLFLEDLCRLSFLGCPRSRRLLAGLVPLVFGKISEVPGLDESRSHVESAKFFLECGWPAYATKMLFRRTWGTPDAYLVGGRVLLLEGMVGEAREAFRVGAGLGDGGCSGHLAALGDPDNETSQQRFRTVQMAAERGFPLPLMVAGQALLNGDGIDSDTELSDVYLFLADRADNRGGSEWRGLGIGTGKVPKIPSTYYSEIVFSWAGKHPGDPIFSAAAQLWRDLLKKTSPTPTDHH
jgi:hypothetical protein